MKYADRVLMQGVYWIQRGSRVPSYSAHFLGPEVPASVDDAALFDTYASLYPGEREYVVFTSDPEWPQWPSDDEMRVIVSSLSPSDRQIREQRDVSARYMSPHTTADEQWSAACNEAARAGLPVAILLFGVRVSDQQRIGYFACHAVAPLEKAVEAFKSASLRHP